MNIDSIISKVFFIFNDEEIYLVGGSVRDRLLGKFEIKDLDFATKALPEQTKELLEKSGLKTYIVGVAYGTVSCKIDGVEIQITTYRRNEHYQRDNRYPIVEFGKTIEDDLSRRDFTFNALAEDKEGNIIDLFNGINHLRNKIISTPLSPEIMFSDDPLRILRAVRFKSNFGFSYTEEVKKALESQAFRLLLLSIERIQEEFNKILLGDYVEEALQDLYDYKLLNYTLPELTILGWAAQYGKCHSKNAWLHTVQVVSSTPKELIIRWAALLHDIGKPYVRTEENGEVHFYRHEELSELLVESLLKRLKMSNKMASKVLFLVRNHMRINLYEDTWSDSAVKKFINFAKDNIDDMFALSIADITSHREETIQARLILLNSFKNRIESLRNYKEIKSPLNGDEIKEFFNILEGREVGAIKKILIKGILDGEILLNQNKQSYIDYIKEKIKCLKDN